METYVKAKKVSKDDYMSMHVSTVEELKRDALIDAWASYISENNEHGIMFNVDEFPQKDGDVIIQVELHVRNLRKPKKF